MQLTHLPLDQLKVSRLNMRHERKHPDVSDLLPSIRARGIQQPLLVRPTGDAFEIVAERRRFFALRAIAKDGEAVAEVPCAIMDETDDAAAIEASLIENTARLDADEVSQWETFSRLTGAGRGVPDIARIFAMSETTVRRVLALGGLLPAIREGYRDDEIDAATIRQLTLADPEQQAAWLALHQDPEQRAPHGRQLKQWLFGGEILTTAALFDVAEYAGEVVTDLFEETVYFADTEQFWRLQNAAIAALAERMTDNGWAKVTVLDAGERFEHWRYVESTKDGGGEVFIETRPNGTVKCHKGYLSAQAHRRQAAKAKREQAGNGGGEETPPRPAREELTQAARNYLSLHRHSAVRHALVSAGEAGLTLRLIAAHALAGSGLWTVEPEPQRAERESIAASLNAASAQTAFAEERSAVLSLLGLPTEEMSLRSAAVWRADADTLLKRLLTLDEDAVLRILTLAMAETLEAGSPVVERLGKRLSVDMREHWVADDVFFEVIRDKGVINAMLREVAGKAVADVHVADTAVKQKQLIRDYLDGKGRKSAEGWLPRYLRFPAKTYGAKPKTG